jgi:hypothetical protein
MLVVTLTGCQDRLQGEFQDPEKHAPKTEEVVPGMLTQMLYTRFFVQDYGEWYYGFFWGLTLTGYSQVAVRRPNPSEAGLFEPGWNDIASKYLPSYGQLPNRFNYYYVDLRNWGLIRDQLETLPADQLADNEMFFLAATVIKDAIGLKTVDNFNKIPYSEAFLGTKGVFFPKYDDGKAVYANILDDLASLATRIPEAYSRMSQRAKESFAKHDIAFGGDPQKWVQWANAVRLRHAVRVSGVDAELAKKHITEAIKNLPTVDLVWKNPRKNGNTLSAPGGEIYARSLRERNVTTALLIPNTMLQRMNYGDIAYTEGEDDPRLPVIANPTRYSTDYPGKYEFVGISMDYDAQYPYWPTQAAKTSGALVDNGPGKTFTMFWNDPSRMDGWLRNSYSTYNSGTFTYGNIPPYMTSLAEVDLLLAEVEAKGLVSTGKSAADHVRDAVIHSTDMWYWINSLTNIWQTQGMPAKNEFLTKAFEPAKPSAAVIEQFADKIKAEYSAASGIEDQMEIIMQQKRIHLNILDVYECWTELRRTRHPKLEQLKVNNSRFTPMLERSRYPDSEVQNNPDNYFKVNSEDNWTTPIFWVPEAKRTENFYMDGYLPLKGFEPLPAKNPNRPESQGGDPNFGEWIP